MTDEELIKRVRQEWTAAGGRVGCGELGEIFDKIAVLSASIAKEELTEKVCEFAREFTLPNGIAPLYDYTGNLRKAMEE